MPVALATVEVLFEKLELEEVLKWIHFLWILMTW